MQKIVSKKNALRLYEISWIRWQPIMRLTRIRVYVQKSISQQHLMHGTKLRKIKRCTYKITNILAAMRPSVSNLVPTQCLDIILLPYGKL